MTFSPDEMSASPAWQERALARSLGDARARSVERLALFVDAARGLAAQTGAATFTVQQVVVGSGQSLKSFYRYFEGKDDLLLALVEEDCHVGARILRARVDREDDPTERLRAWVTGLFDLMAVGEAGYVSVLVREHRRLGELRPADMDRALAPFITFLADELVVAMDAGVARRGDPDRDARTVFSVVLSEIHELVLGRHAPGAVVGTTRSALIRESAEYVWQFCWTGLT